MSARARRAQKRHPRAATERVEGGPFGIDDRFFSVDAEVLAELQDRAGRKLRAILRDRPYSALGGVFLGGFIAGGGWRTPMGRLALVAVARYLASSAAESYFAT